MNIKSFFNRSLFLYIYLLFLPVSFMLDRSFFHYNWLSSFDIFFLTAVFILIHFYVKYHSKISKLKLKGFELEKIVEELEDLKDMVEMVGARLKKTPFVGIDGDEIRKFEEIYNIPKIYKDELSKEEIDKHRKLWNKYVLREKAYNCLAFFDNEAFGLGNEQKKLGRLQIYIFILQMKFFNYQKKLSLNRKWNWMAMTVPLNNLMFYSKIFNPPTKMIKMGSG